MARGKEERAPGASEGFSRPSRIGQGACVDERVPGVERGKIHRPGGVGRGLFRPDSAQVRLDCVMATADRRMIELSLPEGLFCVEWNGRNPVDRIEVDGKMATHGISWFWFVPHFRFEIGEHAATIDVQVGWRLNVKRFVLTVDGREVYREG